MTPEDGGVQTFADQVGSFYEYRVTGMQGRPSATGIYSQRELGPDAYTSVLHVQQARGGQIEVRRIDVSPWGRVGRKHPQP